MRTACVQIRWNCRISRSLLSNFANMASLPGRSNTSSWRDTCVNWWRIRMAIEYQKGHGFLHRLDARTKLLLFVGMTILAVVVADPILMGLLFATLYLIGRRSVNPKLLNSNLRILIVIFVTFAMFQIIFFEAEAAHFL